MADLTVFPDIEAGLLELLADFGTCGTVVPADLDGTLPFVRVSRFGGGDDRISDTGFVDIDTFAVRRADAYQLAESVRQRLISGPHVLTVGTFDVVGTNTGPHEVPWANTGVRRFTAAYQVTTRR